MIVKFIRESIIASAILLLFRLYLGYEWMHAGWGKVTGDFDAKGFLMGALKKATGDHPAVQPWWRDFLDSFAIPNVGLFNFMVPWGEFLVGLGLIVGALTPIAAFFGLVMNFAFLLSGTTSTNPQLAILGIFVCIAGFNAGRFGVDGLLFPFLKRRYGWGK